MEREGECGNIVFIHDNGILWRYNLFFFFNDTATTEIYTLSLHDALPISQGDIPCYNNTLHFLIE